MHPIHRLIHYALKQKLIDSLDVPYAFNRLIEKLSLTDVPEFHRLSLAEDELETILAPLFAHASKVGVLTDDTTEARDRLEAELMDVFLPRPSDLSDRFHALRFKNPRLATEYFYHLSQASNYIKTARINKNKSYAVDSSYGILDITINLSKPEKDPRDIAKGLSKTTEYPKCLLCLETVGYHGHEGFPGRANHRVVALPVNNEPFYLHYSPYAYYNEHAILIHENHIPMEVSKQTFLRLTDFVDRLPHYFIGSNAGLPIVGGSMLSHEHYQGGRAIFPIDAAKSLESVDIQGVTFERLHWPMSVLRLKTKNRKALIQYSDQLRCFWESYSDKDADILAKTTHQHNAITPILRKEDDGYILIVALRNNRTSTQYPDGIFHVHEEHWHIKKENIGLIEVMGLAILPPRLDKDLPVIKEALIKNDSLPSVLNSYQPLYDTLLKKKPWNNLDRLIEESVGETFVKGLEDCAVFKPTHRGEEQFKTFFKAFIETIKVGERND